MTILDGVAVQATRVRPRDRGAALARAWRWVWMRGSIHALLLVAVAGCMYPLVWMFMTSIKTDEELAQSDDVPSLPVFRDHSPYVRDAPARDGRRADARCAAHAGASRGRWGGMGVERRRGARESHDHPVAAANMARWG